MGQNPQLDDEAEPSRWGARLLPYLMAIWCCLAILQDKPSDIPPLWVIAKTIGMVLLAVAVVNGIFLVAIRKSPARELILFQLVGFVGLYGAYRNLLVPSMGNYIFLAFCIVANVGFANIFYRYDKHKFTKAIIPVSLFGIGITLAFQIVGIGLPVANDTRLVGSLIDDLSADDPLQGQQLLVEKDQLPDIYYIIVDAYAREDILRQVYDVDNAAFTGSLRERGFYVGDESRSNYHYTELSLASSMNMTHLHELDLQRFQTRMPIRKMIQDSTVVRFLKRQGYETVAFETGKSDTQCDQFDQYISVGCALNDYQDGLYYKSLIPRMFDWTGHALVSAARRHGARTVETLNLVPRAVRPDAKPTFVFSHVLAPHPPFVFDDQGQGVDLHGHYLLADGSHFTACYGYDIEIYRKAYREQVAYINQKLIEMVEGIQSSNRRSIIIIQADHGPRLGFGSSQSRYPQESKGRYREGFGILNAICMPAGCQADFYSSMTPVNTFRLIINEIFGTKLQLEADESYFEHDYTFRNVTQDALPLKMTIPESTIPYPPSPTFTNPAVTNPLSTTPVSITNHD